MTRYLPALTLGMGIAGILSRMTRAKGLPEWRVLLSRVL